MHYSNRLYKTTIPSVTIEKDCMLFYSQLNSIHTNQLCNNINRDVEEVILLVQQAITNKQSIFCLRGDKTGGSQEFFNVIPIQIIIAYPVFKLFCYHIQLKKSVVLPIDFRIEKVSDFKDCENLNLQSFTVYESEYRETLSIEKHPILLECNNAILHDVTANPIHETQKIYKKEHCFFIDIPAVEITQEIIQRIISIGSQCKIVESEFVKEQVILQMQKTIINHLK